MKSKFIFLIVIGVFLVGAGFGQSKKQGKICGDPSVKCKTGEIIFESYEIPFEIPRNYIVAESQ